MERFWNFLDPPDLSLLYKRYEKGDLRFGEATQTDRDKFSGEYRPVIIGFPYDEGTIRNRGRAGGSFAPAEIRKAFYKLTPTRSHTLSDAILPIFDAGDVRSSLKLEDALRVLEETVEFFFDKKHVPIVLGGSNDISYADFRACSKVFGRCGAVNVDSHLDVRDYSNGINSGTPYRMLLDEKVLKGEDFVEYGTQDFANSREHLLFVSDHGARILTLGEIHSPRNSDTFRDAYRLAGKSASAVYVSFDIDAVRSCDAPGVSAPTPTGLSAEEVLECAFIAGSGTKTVMIDVCEVNPRHDIDGRTAKLAAMIIASFLSGISNRR